MSLSGSLAIVVCLILACMAFLPAARADEWNEATKLMFREPVEIPGSVVPAGTYWFVLFDDQGDRNIVQIFSSDRSTLYATVFTASAERMQSTDHTEIKFAERPHSRPEALLKWYYPGLLTGHEFLYPKREEKELRRDAKQDVVTQPVKVASNVVLPGA
ncbi:MAG: hypothetical protein ABSA54_01200 [Terriglobales bacterium]|jgi:hypothetical protein